MFKITKEFHFSASHALKGLAEDHPCTMLHGHNYVIKVELSNAVLNAVGFVVDYRELDSIKTWIDDTLDHKHLNNVLDFNPTAENMAEYMYDKFHGMIWQVSAVEVSETPKTNARYEPNTYN
jgi:6-pyruvoyltetrahydropterin/6-carboxytetrahydropterin synthase